MESLVLLGRRLEVFWGCLEYLEHIVGNLGCLRDSHCFHLHVSQLLIVKVPLLLHALDLLQESLVLEKLGRQFVL